MSTRCGLDSQALAELHQLKTQCVAESESNTSTESRRDRFLTISAYMKVRGGERGDGAKALGRNSSLHVEVTLFPLEHRRLHRRFALAVLGQRLVDLAVAIFMAWTAFETTPAGTDLWKPLAYVQR